MTSNTAPSGTASASTIWSTTYDAWKAFDTLDNNTFGWMTVSGTLTGWLSYEFPSAKMIAKYSVKSIANSSEGRMPKNWTFEGSNDGTAWTVLDTRTNITGWTDGLVREYTFTNINSYKRYRINITANNGSTVSTSIGELLMFESTFFNKVLISLSDGYSKSLASGGYTSNVVPIMTSNTSPTGEVTASTFGTSFDPFKAFDDNQTNFWGTNNIATGWIAYDFKIPTKVAKYSISPRTGAEATQSPQDFTFQGWDGTKWVVLDTRVGITGWATNTFKEFDLSDEYNYSKYKLDVTKNTSNGSNTYVTIGEIKMYAKKPFILKSIDTPSESNFIKHGMDKSTVLDLSTSMTKKSFIEQSPTTLGSGKVFKKSIDTTNLVIKKATIQ